MLGIEEDYVWDICGFIWISYICCISFCRGMDVYVVLVNNVCLHFGAVSVGVVICVVLVTLS